MPNRGYFVLDYGMHALTRLPHHQMHDFRSSLTYSTRRRSLSLMTCPHDTSTALHTPLSISPAASHLYWTSQSRRPEAGLSLQHSLHHGRPSFFSTRTLTLAPPQSNDPQLNVGSSITKQQGDSGQRRIGPHFRHRRRVHHTWCSSRTSLYEQRLASTHVVG